ncbi:AMP-binding protein [Patulibacter brassicae]|uniref:AMP-binding protein n=1 Tax=Patulibacter brassicae TaxID=1705717 RepID=A0ABU4VLI9_9ACTN|nr:AMP-binding protein [Patulibacter brassicae]MDX8152680.1 AMP-binding protein [Patulibacter brassicae]
MTLSRNLMGVLERQRATRRFDDVAVEHGGETRTFAQLDEHARRLAEGLARQGVRPGDRVAVLLPNRHEWPELLFGLAALGAVCVPINVLLRAAEVDHVMSDSGARVLVADGRSSGLVADLAEQPELVVRVDGLEVPEGVRSVAYADLLADATSGTPAVVDLHDLACLYYSSGTTGKPKAAAHTHDGILWNSFGQIPDFRLQRDDVYLCVPSLSWAAGFHDVTLALWWLGGRNVLAPTGGTGPEEIVELVERHGVSHTLLVPTLLRQFAARPDLLARLRDSSLRWVISGTEPVPVPLIETMADALPDVAVLQGYGLSEFPTAATVLQPEEAVTHFGSAGRPMSYVDLALRDAEGRIVREGEGEILLRSPATMVGYHERPEQTAEAFRDGWLNTGDLGRVDAEGHLTITGRTKDMIISGGLNVYPKEIEEVLYRQPGVEEATVVGLPDERWGEIPVAVVVPSAEGVDVEGVLAACRTGLASYKAPRRVLVRDEPLPRTATGKVVKRDVQPWAAEAIAGAEA